MNLFEMMTVGLISIAIIGFILGKIEEKLHTTKYLNEQIIFDRPMPTLESSIKRHELEFGKDCFNEKKKTTKKRRRNVSPRTRKQRVARIKQVSSKRVKKTQ